MPRLPHGRTATSEDMSRAREAVTAAGAADPLAFAAAPPAELHDVDFLFPTLQDDPDALLPESPETVRRLKALAVTMEDRDGAGGDSPVPAAYTYLGQFLDHDTTLEVRAEQPDAAGRGDLEHLLADDLAPLPADAVGGAVANGRTGTLDLDSVYGAPAPRAGDRMVLGRVTRLGGTAPPLLRVPGKDDDNDLPRELPGPDVEHDRAALIGDPRNDENLALAQLHVAFLRAHNALVDRGLGFERARRVLRQHYQHVVVHDFLRRVCDEGVVDAILRDGNRWFSAAAEPFSMPLEFTVAAFRFGHTMVRPAYDFNTNFNVSRGGVPATLDLLFTFTALSGQVGSRQVGGTPTLPDNWIVEWENLVGDGEGVDRARRFDTALAAVGRTSLSALPDATGAPMSGLAAVLAARNLLRGYRFRLPTGQAVARHLGLPVLTPDELRAAAVGPAQADALRDGGFDARTPLWFYVLAEAAAGGGARLGPVGSTIVAEVVVGLVRRSADSVLRTPGWLPSLPSETPGRFRLADLLRFAGVLPGAVAPTRTRTVRPGDTLTGIAAAELGDPGRWTEVFALNRATVRHPDRIVAGQVLVLPGAPLEPRPRFHVVRRGDTLRGIAERELGSADRWTELLSLNAAVLADPDVIVVGLVLQLPPA